MLDAEILTRFAPVAAAPIEPRTSFKVMRPEASAASSPAEEATFEANWSVWSSALSCLLVDSAGVSMPKLVLSRTSLKVDSRVVLATLIVPPD